MWGELGALSPVTGNPHCPSVRASLVPCGGLYGEFLPGMDVHMPLPGHFNFFPFAAFLKKS